MPTLTDDERSALIQDISSHLEAKGVFAPETVSADVQALKGWRRKAMADGSFGRVFNGPQWLDNVAIRDGAVTGDKLSARVVIATSLFSTVDTSLTPTADRMELDSTSLRFYGTVSAVANTKTAEFKATGDFTLGTTNPITYVASTGVLTVPAAVIGSLTIANVGAGIIGGLYKTSSSNAHLELDTSGIRMYNSSSVKTFDAVASSGALALTGTLTVGTGGQIAFGASAADYLSNNLLHFELTSSEQAKIERVNGSNTPRGLFTGSASSTTSSANLYANYDGTYAATGQISVAPNHQAMVLTSSISTNSIAELYATYATTAASRSSVTAQGGSTVATTFVNIVGGTYGQLYIDTDTGSAYGRVQVQGRLYPGSDTGAQTTRYISDDGTNVRVTNSGGSTGGIFVYDNSGNKALGMRFDKGFESGFGLDGTALGAYQGRYPFTVNGTLRYIGIYA